ncbi:MAG TPA: tetratricopeptide repeat protein [Kofleriaceae bacterium]|nr:tetratricopeptide repeat protein [Kofleriaceae bacterium]
MKRAAFVVAVLIAASSVVAAQPAPQGSAAPTPVPETATGAPGVPAPPPLQPAANATAKPLQLTPKEMEELKDVEAEYDTFTKEAAEHDKRVRGIARTEFDDRTHELERRYSERIAKTEADRGKRHTDTIALLEKFLQDHPDRDQETPDAMYRLADLYLDQANEDVDQKLAALETAGSNAPPQQDQAAIVADYSKSLQLWEDILTKFPKYRQTAPTLYLLAYYSKAKDDRRSLEIFLSLACSNRYTWNGKPPAVPTREEAIKRVESKQLRDPYADCTPYPGAETELVRHAWVRGIADYHFTVPGELDEAIAAYLKVANGGNDSRLFAESLYKLAWSYYKRDMLKSSIERFDQSVKLYDETVAKGEQPPLELRDESIQYIAVAFTDPWEGETDTDPVKAFARAQEFYKGRENEKHVRDVWVALGHAFADLQAWDQAVDSYRIAIGPPWELDPHNPLVHQEIVNVFEQKGDKFAADQAAADLATKYAPGTAWYAANEKDREAMDNQRRIAERALYAAARNTHANATQLRKDYEAAAKKDPQAKAEYIAMYAKAAELYRSFIDQYSDSDYVYEFNFLMGETLFYAEHYPEAIAQYKWVRDHRDMGTAYYLDAARSILKALENEAAAEVAAGKLQPLKVPTVADLQALPQPWQPQPIPPTYVDLQAEYDNYQNVVNDPSVAPSQGINAALISLAYLHIDDAIKRFDKVEENFCHTPPPDPRDPKSIAPAAKAKDGILTIYQAQNNFDAIQATNNKFIQLGCGDKAAVDLAISQNRSLNFSRAADLYKKQQYIPAAQAFYRFYKNAPQTDPDLPTALYNAAVAYKLGDKPKTAIGLFKEFTSKTDKRFKESPYYLDAMRLTAASQQAAFQYDDAIKTYLDLYDTTKRAKKLGIKPPDPIPGEPALTLDQIGLDAVYNAAYAAEVSRDFKRAVDLYGQYMKIEPDKRKQDRSLWSVANIYRQEGDIGDMTDTLDRWRARYGKDPQNADDLVKSYYQTAQVLHAKGRTAQARQAEQDTIDAWKRTGSPKNTPGAKLAAEIALADAENYYTTAWEPLEIKTAASSTNVKTAQKQVLAQKDSIEAARKKAEDKYIGLDQFGVIETSMAAKVRFGDIQYDRGQKIANIPVPKIISNNDEVVAAFEQQRDQALAKDLAEAKQDWADVVTLAKQGGVSNKWSQHALENLGREFPDEYPNHLRQELIQGTDAP